MDNWMDFLMAGEYNSCKSRPISKLKQFSHRPALIARLWTIALCCAIAFSASSQTYLLNSSLNGSTISTCGGSFYDSGGSGIKYGNNQNHTVTFCSDNGGMIRVFFSDFKLKNNDDYLYIYDGSSTSAPQVTGSPFTDDVSPGLIVSSGTCLTFRFNSDQNDIEDGWEASLSCILEIPEICGNGIDDDTDGLIDEMDPECYSYSSELIPSGSYIINMGVEPQTEENALLPYGLIWKLLKEHQVPIKWAINAGKEKDGIDFSYGGTDFKGGPFIISEEFRTAAVNQIISEWEADGVIGVTTSSDFYAPIERTITYSMNWTLDSENGKIAEDILVRAGLPESAYNWVLPENLNCCNDVFAMPHAEPEWESHQNLLNWNNKLTNGGCGGAIWAGCKAVSELENIVNPSNSTERLNFLMLNSDDPLGFPAVWSGDHDNGTMPYNYSFENHPIMQFIGTMDGAQEGGAEQIYFPTKGWRPSTHIGVYDPDHPDLFDISNGPAAKLAFGFAFGDIDRGYVLYEGGHDVGGDNPENISAQRAFLNFSFMAVAKKAIKPIVVVPTSMKSGEDYSLSGAASGGSGNFQYQWTSSCGGSFSNPNSAGTTFSAPVVSVQTSCNIKLIVTDDCGSRVGFENIQIDIWPDEICDNNIDDDGDGLIDCQDPDCSNALQVNASVSDAEICSGNSVSLISSTTGGLAPYSFIWDNSVGAGASATVSPTATTTYNVTVTDGNGCTKSDDVTVTVASPPVFSISPAATICSGESAIISASPTGTYSYSWNNGLPAGNSHTVTPNSNTAYSVTATDSYGCSSTNSTVVSVNPTPVVALGNDFILCKGMSSILSAVVTGGVNPISYSWNNGLGTGNDKVISPSSNKTYSVTATSGNGCLATDQINVTVNNCSENCSNGKDDDGDGLIDCDDPDCGLSIQLNNDLNICSGNSTLLAVTVMSGSGSLSYSWSNGHSGQSQTVAPTTTTIYAVTVSNSKGCSATAGLTVTVNNCNENCSNGIDDDGDGLVDCLDPDCIVNSAPHLLPDSYSTCPGMPFSARVTYNDDNLQNPTFDIVLPPANGSATIDNTGKFTYIPYGFFCATETFVYEVCNNGSGCCATATVTLQLGDDVAPTLSNVPADITIGCDDAVPSPPEVVGFDECPGIYMDFEETSNIYEVGGCETFTITRVWSASDFCGNSVSAAQTITVLDQTAPEMFRVYTLENGKRLVAGISKRVTNDWKYVPFPISFNGTPMIFTTLVSNNDISAVTVKHRNPYSQGFEVRVQEEESADGNHSFENIAWIAVEPGVNTGDLNMEVGRWMNIDHNPQAVNYSNPFAGIPYLFANIQSSNDTDPASLRVDATSNTGANLFVEEEASIDSEKAHGFEHVGFMAVEKGASLTDQDGEVFGETGSLYLTNAWATVNLKKKYTKPVIIFGGVSNNYSGGVNTRVRNSDANSFEVRLQEWDYLDGNHGPELVDYMVVEGSIPGHLEYYCSGNSSNIIKGVNLFALDNCDPLRTFEVTETPSYIQGLNVTARTWVSTDDCDNVNEVVRYDTCTVVAFRAKALLYGAKVNAGNGFLLRDDLRGQGLLPTKEPYSNLPAFPHVSASNTNLGNDDFGSDNNGADKVTICHKPGTAYQKSLNISASAVDAHLAHGDVLGECPLPETGTFDYSTVADGNWTDVATWLNGAVPPTGTINNKKIKISHAVVLSSSNLELNANAEMSIDGGSLTLNNGYFRINLAQLEIFNGSLDIEKANIEIQHNQAVVFIHNSIVAVQGNFVSTAGELWVESSFVDVSGNFSNYATVHLIQSSMITGQSFSNVGSGVIDVLDTKIKVINTHFLNDTNASIIGENLTVWLLSGNLENKGIWTAGVAQYCVALELIGLPNTLPVSPDCAGLNDLFTAEAALLDVEDNQSVGEQEEDQTTSEETLDGELSSSILGKAGEDAIVDWVVIEVRNPSDGKEILAYATLIMQRNGQLVNDSGNEVIQFPNLQEGEYYVAVRHRNHLPLVTSQPVMLSSDDITEIDFTDIDMPVMGGANAGKIVNDVRYMWAGDFNEDGKVIYQGPYNDVFHLFSRVLGDPTNEDYLANFIIKGYDLPDFNLDGSIIFQGPNNDRANLLYHSILSHTINTDFLANYIVSGTLP